MSDLKFWKPNDATININVEGLVGTKCTATYNGNDYQCIIAGADPYIGLSVVLQDDHKTQVICLHGPFDPQLREEYLKDENLQKGYGPKFEAIVEEAYNAKETGFFNADSFLEEVERIMGGGYISVNSSLSCPYGV